MFPIKSVKYLVKEPKPQPIKPQKNAIKHLFQLKNPLQLKHVLQLLVPRSQKSKISYPTKFIKPPTNPIIKKCRILKPIESAGIFFYWSKK